MSELLDGERAREEAGFANRFLHFSNSIQANSNLHKEDGNTNNDNSASRGDQKSKGKEKKDKEVDAMDIDEPT